MIFTRWKKRMNKKGMSLVEMVVAIAVTGILAVCLSMIMSPVMNTYSLNKTRAELANYSDRILTHMASDFRGARNIMLVGKSDSSPYPSYSVPALNYGKHGIAPSIDYGYCLSTEYFDGKGDKYKLKNTPILSKVTQWNDYYRNERNIYPANLNYVMDWDSFRGARPEFDREDSGVPGGDGYTINYYYKDPLTTETGGIYVDGDSSATNGNAGFYMLVKANPDDGGRGNIIDIHIRLRKGKIKYEASKAVVCETLVLNKIGTQKATIPGGMNGLDPAVISTKDTPGSTGCTPYYSCWFGIGVHQQLGQ